MRGEIVGVESGSIAEQLGLRPGDELLSINGQSVEDWIDYQALSCEEKLTLVARRGEEEIEYAFEKDEYEPLGLRFSTPLMSETRLCANKCVFCFVDQLPADARPSLRVKDDDWRMSLMMGNFVTLTNVSDKELSRIISRGASPLYISVHATDAKVREYLLGSPRAGRLMSQLNRLAAAGLRFHAQAVICPGVNDGRVLEETVSELAALAPACLSLALVPVGLTGHREALTPLRRHTREEARTVLARVDAWQKKYLAKLGTRFVFASDEYYATAGRAFPPEAAYEDYAQIENGVGMARLLETEYREAYEALDLSLVKPDSVAIATGIDAAPLLRQMLDKYPLPGVRIEVRALVNHYFGAEITVAGLLTGGDLIAQMKDCAARRILITECMLREGEDVFLDGVTLAEAVRALERPVVKVGRRGDALLAALTGVETEGE